MLLTSFVNLDIISPEGFESKNFSFKSNILKYKSFLKYLLEYWAIFVIKTDWKAYKIVETKTATTRQIININTVWFVESFFPLTLSNVSEIYFVKKYWPIDTPQFIKETNNIPTTTKINKNL